MSAEFPPAGKSIERNAMHFSLCQISCKAAGSAAGMKISANSSGMFPAATSSALPNAEVYEECNLLSSGRDRLCLALGQSDGAIHARAVVLDT